MATSKPTFRSRIKEFRNVPASQLKANKSNWRIHPQAQFDSLRTMLKEVGYVGAVIARELPDKTLQIIDGHLRTGISEMGGKDELVPTLIVDLTEKEAKKILATYDPISAMAEMDTKMLGNLLQEITLPAELLEKLWDKKELEELGIVTPPVPVVPEILIDRAEELQKKWKVCTGDIFILGNHAVICGDCREPETWERLLRVAKVEKVNGIFTSPPYAEQRKAQYGGVPVAEYVEWWEAVQANARENLAGDGSFFVNIKPHCENGERVLYVFDLVLAMRRRWGWRFVDELIYKSNGVPGLFKNRFRNVFEPVYQFALTKDIKWSPRPNEEKIGRRKGIGYSSTGSGIQNHFEYDGDALPTNCIECNSAGNETKDAFNAHSAMFPVALPNFFIRAYSDLGDVWLDPFCGSGTVLVAAENNQRRGLGIEKMEKYCAVILERMSLKFPNIPIEHIK